MPSREPRELAELDLLLAQLAEALSGELDLDRLLELVVEAAWKATGAGYAALGVIDETGESLVRFIHAGVSDDIARRIGALPTGGGLLGSLIRDPRPRIVDDLPAHEEFQGFPPHHPPMSNFMGTPIKVDGRVFGNLYLTDKPDGFTDVDARSVTILATQAGMAIHAATLAQTLKSLAINDERERISRDLHDGVIQNLFSVGMGLESAKTLVGTDDARLTQRLDAAIDQLDVTIREVRTTIFTLRPDHGGGSLQQALVGLAREYEATGAMKTSVNVSRSLDALVPEHVAPDVLHIVREALSNAARHADSPAVLVEAGAAEGAIVITVRDQGRGFDTTATSTGHGLGNMVERAELLGADLRVQSTPGEGTTVALTVPLPQSGDAGRHPNG